MTKFKRIGALLLAAVLLLALVSCFGGPGKQSDRGRRAEPPAELALSLSENLFLADQQVVLELRVSCGEAVTGDVTITDEAGTVVAQLKNNGSGSLKTQIPFRRQQVGEGSFTARAGRFQSTPVSYCVQPLVTEEMVGRLWEVSAGLGTFLEDSKLEDPHSKNALKRVKAYLKDHPLVDNVEQNGTMLLYQTTDGLMGSYTAGQAKEGCLGFSQTEDVYQDWTEGKDISARYIESPAVPTSGRCLILAPDYHERPIQYHSDEAYAMMSEVFDSTQLVVGNEARNRLAAGDYTDCEFLILNAHGNTIRRSDGGTMLLITAANLEKKQDCIACMNNMETGFQILWKPFHSAAEACHAAINSYYDKTDKQFRHELLLSSRLLQEGLRGKTFDNTVVYLAVCYGFLDAQLSRQMLDHGASMVVGCRDTLESGYSLVNILELRNRLLEKSTDTTLATYAEAFDGVSTDSVADLMRWYGHGEDAIEAAIRTWNKQATPEDRQQYPEDAQVCQDYRIIRTSYDAAVAARATFSFAFRTPDSEARVLYGRGDVTGRVLTKDGKPAADAVVTLYRWLDHSFEAYEVQAQTDGRGRYRLEQVPYGVYAAEAEHFGAGGSVTVIIDQPRITPEDILVDGNVIVWGEADWHPRDIHSIQNNYDSYIVSPVLLESPSRALAAAVQRERSHALETIDSQIQSISKGPSGNYENPGFAYLTIHDAYCAGDVLSVQMEGSAYHPGNMRPLRMDGSYSLNVGTGEYVSFADILSGTGHYPKLRAAWMQLLEAYRETELFESRAELADRAMAGKTGSWAFTRDGLWIGFGLYEIAPYAAGAKETVIPYDLLQGELAQQYLPRPASGTKMTVKLLTPDDRRIKDAQYTVLGDRTDQALLFDGTAQDVYVYACKPDSEGQNESVLLYARSLTDAIVWLGECESGRYRVCWRTGSTEHTTMVEI